MSQIAFGLGRSRIDTATVARPVLCRPLLTWQHEGARPVIKNCQITTTTGQHLTAVPSSARNSQVPSWIPALMPRSFSVTFLSQIPIKMMLHRSFLGNCDLVDMSQTPGYLQGIGAAFGIGTDTVTRLFLYIVPLSTTPRLYRKVLHQPKIYFSSWKTFVLLLPWPRTGACMSAPPVLSWAAILLLARSSGVFRWLYFNCGEPSVCKRV